MANEVKTPYNHEKKESHIASPRGDSKWLERTKSGVQRIINRNIFPPVKLKILSATLSADTSQAMTAKPAMVLFFKIKFRAKIDCSMRAVQRLTKMRERLAMIR